VNKYLKRFGAFVLAFMMALPTVVFADDFILVDENNIFRGRANAAALINGANFTDLSDAWPAEAVVRGVAFGAIHGGDSQFFRPNDTLTRQEALNIIMRAMGLSAEAAARGNEAIAEVGSFPVAQNMINLGYSLLAIEREIIPADFPLFGTATRQEVAFMLFNAVVDGSNIFNEEPELVNIYNFMDWQLITPAYIAAIENIAAFNVMQGDGLYFNPRENITRGQMAQTISNLDTILLSIHGLERRLGTVVRVRDAELTQTAQAQAWRNVYVRLGDGSADVLQYQLSANPSAQAGAVDAVVFNGGAVGGLNMLNENDTIEYFVHTATNTVWYVNVMSQAIHDTIEGQLFSLDRLEMTVTLRFEDESRRIFSLVDGLVETRDGIHYIWMDNHRQPIANLPFGQHVRLYLRNDVVTGLAFVGHPVLVDEFRGLVVENNPAFGYMVVVDAEGRRVVMRYYEAEMMVQRISHWETSFSVSYISQLFPSFAFNPLVTTIGTIVPGDIVFIRPEYGDNAVISQISAISNYIMRFGRIVNIVHHEDYMSVLFEQENGQTAWLEVANNTFITREGRRIAHGAIMVGDWARMLVNEAVVAPGHTMSSVIEMTISGEQRHISNIIRGNLSGINTIQNMMMVEHAQSLHQVGWVNFREVAQFSIASNGISYYYNNRRITRDEALRLFGRGHATVYIALENHFAGERVSMVSFRSHREERLPADTVIEADGLGQFWISSSPNHAILTDDGTIVRRHGRLVSGMDVMPGDFVSVVLNGPNRAAVVDITDRPDTSGLQIMRARVTQVWDGQSFRVASMSQLFHNNWVFTPIQREFTIDTRTIFLPYHDGANFLTYTDTSVYNQVFTIVTDGARASHIFTHPFANRAVRGTLVSDVADNDGNFMLRNVSVQNPITNQWHPLSNVNNTMTVNLDASTLIGRNNAIVNQRELRAGDQVLIMSESVDTAPSGTTMGSVYARIILVE